MLSEKKVYRMENEITQEKTAGVPVSDAKQSENQQTQKDTTANQQQPPEKYYYMDKRTISMYVIPKQLIGKYSYKELTGGEAKDSAEFEKGLEGTTGEPKLEFTATATFLFEELQKFFKVVKTLKAEHITISLKTNEPIKITATNKEGDSIAYWLAPYMME